MVDIVTLINFLANEIDGDHEIFYVLLKEFGQISKALLAEGCSGDLENLKKLAFHGHKIKSACQSFGAVALYELIENMETNARAGNAEQTKVWYSQLGACEKQTLEIIENCATDYFKSKLKSA